MRGLKWIVGLIREDLGWWGVGQGVMWMDKVVNWWAKIRQWYHIVHRADEVVKLHPPQSRGSSATRPATYSRDDEMSTNSPRGGVADGLAD